MSSGYNKMVVKMVVTVLVILNIFLVGWVTLLTKSTLNSTSSKQLACPHWLALGWPLPLLSPTSNRYLKRVGGLPANLPRMRECYLLEETRVIWETENWLRYTNSSSWHLNCQIDSTYVTCLYRPKLPNI